MSHYNWNGNQQPSPHFHGIYYPPPSPRSNTTIAAILIIVGYCIVPALPVVAAITAFYIVSKEPRDCVYAFAHAVRERKFAKARAMLTDELQSEMTLEKFRAQMDDSPFSHGDPSLRFMSITNGRSACFDGEVSGVDMSFQLTKVEGDWRIGSVERGHRCD